MQSLLLLLAPAFFAASIYMSLARIAQGIGAEDRCIISPRWLTRIFVTGDVLSLFVVAGGERQPFLPRRCLRPCWWADKVPTDIFQGGGIMAMRTANGMRLGANIVVGGLVLQLIFFGIFIAVAVAFDRAMHTRPTTRSTKSEGVNWRKHLKVLYATSGLILVRNIVRVVEYAQGNDGYLLGHEFILYVFDAALMLVVMVVLNVWHPSEIMAFAKGGKFSKNGFWLGTLDGSTVC